MQHHPDDIANANSHLDRVEADDNHTTNDAANDKVVRRRGIYLLPNLITSGALFAGFFAIIAAINEHFIHANIAILAAIILDGLDGRVARMTNTQSAFGEQYDSLSDMVSFGVAPAIVMFLWAFEPLGKLGWFAAFVYMACAALRLARFNSQIGFVSKRYFIGIPSPTAAALVSSFIWVANEDLGWTKGELPLSLAYFAAAITVLVGVLMVLNVKYYSFKEFDPGKKVPFIIMLGCTLVGTLLITNPAWTILIFSVAYTLSGPGMMAFRRMKKSL